jgi:hypothetical protein
MILMFVVWDRLTKRVLQLKWSITEFLFDYLFTY